MTAYQHYPDPDAPYGRDPVTGGPLSDKSAIVAGILQLLIPGTGRFYLGYTSIATAQLLMFISGLLTITMFFGIGLLFGIGFWIWSIGDGIAILTDSVPDPYGRKLRS